MKAAGFESYCIQELRGLVNIFREKEGTWAGVAQNEWYKENPQLVAELPANLKSQEFNLEVSERLRQLAIALKRRLYRTCHAKLSTTHAYKACIIGL